MALTAEKVLVEFRKCGITHVVWLPDNKAQFLYASLNAQPDITMVPVCREGEAVPIAAGLLLGGKRPLILHQNTGFFESGDSVRGTALDLCLPLVFMIGQRGAGKEVDSATFLLEPVLNAFGIKYYFLTNDDDAENISRAYQEAQETSRPVAILIAKEVKS